MNKLVSIRVVDILLLKNEYIENVILAGTVLEFIAFIKKELTNNGNLIDFEIQSYCFILDSDEQVFLYKINEKIIAIKENSTGDVNYFPPFNGWHSFNLINWISENNKIIDKIIKLRSFL